MLLANVKGALSMIYNCKGVIFDFNGTLFFDSEKHVLAWGKMAEELRGFGIGLEEMQAHFYGVPNNCAIESPTLPPSSLGPR